MRKSTLDAYKQRLLDMGRRLNMDVAQLDEDAIHGTSADVATEVREPEEMASCQVQRDETLDLLDAEKRQLDEIAAALTRIEEGTYGRCEACGASIPSERLDAIPYVRRCIGCAQNEGA